MNDFQKPHPGDPFIPSAAKESALIDMLAWFQSQTRDKAIESAPKPDVMVRNTRGAGILPFSVVRLGDFAIDPAVNLDSFKNDRIFDTAAPLKGSLFGITQEPCADEGLAEVRISGPTICKVDFGDSGHLYADIEDDNYDNLVSQEAAGPVRILKKESGDGLLWALVEMNYAGIQSINGDNTAAQIIGFSDRHTDVNVGTFPAAWSSTKYYMEGWLTSLTGSVYRCILDHENQSPPNTTYWEDVTTSGVVVLNIPDAGTGRRGLITAGEYPDFQQIHGEKVFLHGVISTAYFFVSDDDGGDEIFSSGATFLYADLSATINVQAIADDTYAQIRLYAIGATLNGSPAANTTLVLSGTDDGAVVDAAPRYAINNGTLYLGAWGTDAVGNVFKGGICTTVSTVIATIRGGTW